MTERSPFSFKTRTVAIAITLPTMLVMAAIGLLTIPLGFIWQSVVGGFNKGRALNDKFVDIAEAAERKNR